MARPTESKDLRLIYKVSQLRYEQHLAQAEISKRLNLSPARISRLLKYARENGIVQTIVTPARGIYTQLEEKLESTFHLREAVVVGVDDAESPDAVTREIGSAAANYLIDNLQDGEKVGVTWGTALNAMVAAIRPRYCPKCHIVQIIGGLGSPTADEHVTGLCRRLAAALSCDMTLLPASGIVGSRRSKDVIMSDPYVKKALGLFPKLDIVFVGVGAPTPDSVLRRDGSIITDPELDALLKKGAVGDIALRFFGRDGKPIKSEIDERVIGITLDQLKAIKRVVGVSGGPHKKVAIRGALLGGFLDTLIVDRLTAESLIKE